MWRARTDKAMLKSTGGVDRGSDGSLPRLRALLSTPSLQVTSRPTMTSFYMSEITIFASAEHHELHSSTWQPSHFPHQVVLTALNGFSRLPWSKPIYLHYSSSSVNLSVFHIFTIWMFSSMKDIHKLYLWGWLSKKHNQFNNEPTLGDRC